MPIQPTLDIEIDTLKQNIADNIPHISRKNYIDVVNPMKSQLVSLIGQNKTIKAANKIITEIPTAEQLEFEATRERGENIKTETEKIYPYFSDQFREIGLILAEEFPSNSMAQIYNTNIQAAENKYPVP